MAGLVPVVALVRLPLAVGRERDDRRLFWVGLARCWVLREQPEGWELGVESRTSYRLRAVGVRVGLRAAWSFEPLTVGG